MALIKIWSGVKLWLGTSEATNEADRYPATPASIQASKRFELTSRETTGSHGTWVLTAEASGKIKPGSTVTVGREASARSDGGS